MLDKVAGGTVYDAPSVTVEEINKQHVRQPRSGKTITGLWIGHWICCPDTSLSRERIPKRILS